MIPYTFLALLMTLTIILYKINKNKCSCCKNCEVKICKE